MVFNDQDGEKCGKLLTTSEKFSGVIFVDRVDACGVPGACEASMLVGLMAAASCVQWHASVLGGTAEHFECLVKGRASTPQQPERTWRRRSHAQVGANLTHPDCLRWK